MNRKSFRLELKQIGDTGEFTGYAAVFGNEDFHGDVIEQGAFKRTIDHSGGKIPILWQHSSYEPIGIGLEMQEDATGLQVKAALNLDTIRGREAYSLLKQGALKGLSIGYDVVKDSWDNGKRILKELKLWEYSLVTFPANPMALISNVKSVDKQEIEKTIKTLQALLNEPDPADPGESHSSGKGTEGPGHNEPSDPDIFHSLEAMVHDMKQFTKTR
ncbi:MAG: HK97 family phage prohead protease [Nitrospirae bacterium]|nr:HK97 family phage prohead protease [Nitrospirota bacterium]